MHVQHNYCCNIDFKVPSERKNSLNRFLNYTAWLMKLLVSTTSRFDSQLLVWAKQRRKLPEETPCTSQRMASLWLAEQYSILMQTAGSSVLWQLWEGAAQARCLPAQEQSSWWLLSPQHCDHSSPCHKGPGLGFHSCPLNHGLSTQSEKWHLSICAQGLRQSWRHFLPHRKPLSGAYIAPL